MPRAPKKSAKAKAASEAAAEPTAPVGEAEPSVSVPAAMESLPPDTAAFAETPARAKKGKRGPRRESEAAIAPSNGEVAADDETASATKKAPAAVGPTGEVTPPTTVNI